MTKYDNTSFGYIGIEPIIESHEDTKEDECIPKYASFDIKRLTTANSFVVIDEQFYIAKKLPDCKASKIYHVYRVSDKRYVCPSVHDKEETIKLVQRKYLELDL